MSDHGHEAGRNDPCPCGSGKKHKNCCWGVVDAPGSTEPRSPRYLLWALLGIALLGWAVFKNTLGATPPEESTTLAFPRAAATPTPGPWFHDVANDRHWDPTEGHKHWHMGPPPPENQRGGITPPDNMLVYPDANQPAAAATPTPGPWFHDVANNRHWDPTEGHKHWHMGPPPADRPPQSPAHE